MVIALVLAGLLAWLIHTNCLQRTGSSDQAVAWAIGAFVLTAINIAFGIVLGIVYLIVMSNVPQAKKSCEDCGKENEPMAVVCQYCGKAFAQPETQTVQKKVCPKCNRSFSDDSAFCPKCGVGLEEVEARASTPGPVFIGTCPKCEAKNLPHRSHCWKCEHELASEAVEP